MNYLNIYVNFIKKFLKPKRPLKVVFDCSNGTTGGILKFLKTKKLKAIYINEKPDGNFPAHGPNPLAVGAMEQLKKEVIRQKADLGVIFDADGDRAFFVDNFGRFINPDVIARLLIWYLQPKKVVIDVRTGWLIKKIQDSRFKIYESQVGHSYIKKLMKKNKAEFGAEVSGHYYFKISDTNNTNAIRMPRIETLYYDDGIIAAIEVMNAVSKSPYSLADFNDLLPQYYRSGEVNIKYNTNLRIYTNATNLLEEIENKYKKQAIKFSHLDGLTMEFADWWFNLRPSNTEPLIRLNIEAENQETLKKKKKELINIINANTGRKLKAR